MIFVARSFEKRCPSFSKTLPVVLKSDGQRILILRATFFSSMGNGFYAYGQRNFEWFNWGVCSVGFTHGCDPITVLRFCLRNVVGMNFRLVWCGKLQLGYVMWIFHERRRCGHTTAVGATHGIDATPSNRTAERCPAYKMVRRDVACYVSCNVSKIRYDMCRLFRNKHYICTCRIKTINYE